MEEDEHQVEEDEHQMEEEDVEWVQVAVLLRHKCEDFMHATSQYVYPTYFKY